MVAPILLGTMLANVSDAHPHPEPVQMTTSASMAWDYTKPQRLGLKTDVYLPEMIWFASGYNKQARVREFSLGLIADCKPQTVSRRVVEVACTLERVGLQAMSLPQEQGLVEPIVGEIDARLTGAIVQLQMRNDGALKNIDIDGLTRRNQRFGRINENLRLIVTRAFAGLDLPLPKSDPRQGWIQNRSWLLSAPALTGAAGVSEIVNKVISNEGHHVFVASAGRGIVSPRDGINTYTLRLEAEATIDSATGTLVERTWMMAGGPTPGSLIAQGFEGYPYLQRGHIVALGPEEEWDVGVTKELPPTNSGMSTLQQQFLGAGL